ncbi:putative cytochrome P450 [Stachybotrys elegans]|uniref:Cytochrome P450 n=1 Tax=Stachybotrys elegans TaxID=80388 RepID=A0A8K0SV74_9HYPO|nr:putative cytochrome P450 [Stachybotrys elegans]
MDSLLRPAVAGPLVVGVYVVYRLLRSDSRLPDIPVIGQRDGEWFPWLRATWRNSTDFRRTVIDAYNEHRDHAALLPVFGLGNAILLPVSETQWIVDQPDSVLSIHQQTIESLQTDHTIPDPRLVHHDFHHRIIVTTLTSQIGNLVPDVADECQWSFDKFWGRNADEWTEVGVYDTLRRVVGNVTNRVFVGLPYCRNEDLVGLGLAFAQDVPTSVIMLKFVWSPLRSLAAMLVARPNRVHAKQFADILRPEIERRQREYDDRVNNMDKYAMQPEPNDFLQWNIKLAKASGSEYECRPTTLAGRLLLLNFAAIHTSSFAITHAILDLVHSKKEYIEELREEIQTVLAEHGGTWSKQALAKMDKLDSTMRESVRLNSLITIGVGRRVVAKDGVTTPSGVHIPYGTSVWAHAHPVFTDPALYKDPNEFKPFRFAEGRRDKDVEYVKRARNAFATTNTDFLAFGHGRNACPGRFFAASELKLLLGHVILHYDFEMRTERPPNKWIVLNLLPPMEATIRVKRRKV